LFLRKFTVPNRSYNVARVLKSVGLWKAGYEARMVEGGTNGYVTFVESGHREATLRQILRRQVVRMEGGWNWLRIVSSGGLWY
jgi:hypothetical protein